MAAVGVITANSNSGESCVRFLLSRDDASTRIVRAIVRSEEKATEVRKSLSLEPSDPRVQFAYADAKDHASLVKAFEGLRSVLIVTPFAEDRGTLARSMVKAAKETGVQHVIVVGSWTVSTGHAVCKDEFGDTESLLAELYPHHSVVLRGGYFNINILHLVGAIKNGLLPMPFPSDTAFSPVDPDEIGEVAAKLIGDYSGSAYHEPLHVVNLSGPEVVTPAIIAEKISTLTGRTVKHVETTIEQTVETMKKHGSPSWIQAFIPAYVPALIRGDIASPSKDVVAILGKSTSFSEWLEKNKAAFV